ncbi:hypothetical protein ID866_5842 [Astraeus odoratus]|nr:hypothetical protein ID866_5842 [Astraeus odoratus]
MTSKEYRIERGLHRFRVWDTVGLNEPNINKEDFGSTLLVELTSSCSAYGVVG